MRALLIVNPRATSTTRLRRDVIASALASVVELEVTETRYRGHATKLASVARSDGFGLVLTLGGDGTVNEAANGILAQLLFMFEYNVRASSIMGFVGAGGIGFFLLGYIQLLRYELLLTELLLTRAVVVVIDRLSALVRRSALVPAEPAGPAE